MHARRVGAALCRSNVDSKSHRYLGGASSGRARCASQDIQNACWSRGVERAARGEGCELLAGWSGTHRRLTVIEVSVGVGELGSAAVGEQEDQAAVSTSAVSASEWVIEEAMIDGGVGVGL